VGYRSQNNWDVEERKASKQLPLGERYDWRSLETSFGYAEEEVAVAIAELGS
jgi:hypothetical protein